MWYFRSFRSTHVFLFYFRTVTYRFEMLAKTSNCSFRKNVNERNIRIGCLTLFLSLTHSLSHTFSSRVYSFSCSYPRSLSFSCFLSLSLSFSPSLSLSISLICLCVCLFTLKCSVHLFKQSLQKLSATFLCLHYSIHDMHMYV